jgi:hypothetical protein
MIKFLELIKSSPDLQFLVFAGMIALCVTIYQTAKLFSKRK